MSYMNIENFKEYLCFKFAWLKHTLMTYRNFHNKYLKIFLFKQILPKSSPLSLSRGSIRLFWNRFSESIVNTNSLPFDSDVEYFSTKVSILIEVGYQKKNPQKKKLTRYQKGATNQCIFFMINKQTKILKSFSIISRTLEWLMKIYIKLQQKKKKNSF